MADSKYPNQLDTDVELIRVDDNITEIGGDAINGLRSAVFNIEETLGINPHGTSTDVAARLNQSLNPDGTIKASALSTIGLVTLPITNVMVAANAGIVESKLHLDYRTKILRELIGALRVEHDALVLAVQGDITNLSRHVAHPSSFGRHRTSDIDGYIGTYAGYDLQGIVEDLDTRIIDHLADPIDAHDASAISFDDTDTFITADEVQTAIEKLDALGVSTLTMHQDEQHSNGILSEQKVYAAGNHGDIIVASTALNAISAGATTVAYTVPPGTLAQVTRGDRIDITISSVVYSRDIDSVSAAFGTVTFFNALETGGINATAVIYRSSEETWAPNTLSVAIRHDTVTGNQGGALLQLIHPSSPYILSNGLDVRSINAGARNIRIAWADGETVDIDAYQALQTYPAVNSSPSTWTPHNLAIALNEEFKDDTYNYPLIAFVYRGEVGIAFDEPDGYIELRTPLADSAWGAFGLAGSEIDYSLGPRKFYIDGYGFSSIRKIVSATGITDNTTSIKSIGVDLEALGIGQTGLVRVKNHVDAGTYVFNASSANSLTITSHIGGFAADASVLVEIYADSFAVPIVPLYNVLYELFIDGYGDDSGELKAAARVEYLPGGGSAGNPQSWFNIIEISRDFSAGSKRLHFQNIAGDRFIELGNPILVPPANKGVTDPGTAVLLPTTNVEGFRFRLYDYNNIDYVDIEIADDAFLLVIAGAERAIDLTIHRRISEEKYVQIGQVLHDADRFKHLSDRRLFGTIGRKDIRNDYTRDYISYPRSLLRGNGVIYGCTVLSGPIVDGGQIHVDGNIYSIGLTTLSIPTDGVAATYNIFIDSEGVLRFLQDNQASGVLLTTPSVAEIISSSDKVLLGQVSIDDAGTVTEIRDCRRFVNNLDNKIDLIVEENDITHGAFASLRAAVNYLNAKATDYPSSVVIKIRGTIYHDVTSVLTIPTGVTIVGDSPPFVGVGSGARIVLTGTGSAFINPTVGVTLKNLHITTDANASCDAIIAATTIETLTIENCIFDDMFANGMFACIEAVDITTLTVINTVMKPTSVNGAAYGMFITGAMINCIMEHSTIEFEGTGAQTAFSVDSIDDFSMNGVNIIFNSATTNYAIDSTTDITSLYMNHCTFVYPAVSTHAYVVKSLGGQIIRSWINNCVFDLQAPSAGGAVIDVLLCQNVFVKNNHIAYSAIVATNFGINATTLTQCQIRECYFANVNSGVVSTSALGNIISGCGFSVEDSAIDLTNASNVMIQNNIVLKTTAATGNTNLIKITDSSKIVIQKNILFTTSANLSLGFMIAVTRVATDMTNIFIKDNILVNSGDNIGIVTGIHVASNTIAGGTFIQVTGNSIYGFFGAAASNGILMTNIAESIVSYNSVKSVRTALSMSNCYLNIITNNYFAGVENVNVVFMELTVALGTAGQSIFSNNYVGNSNNVMIGQDLVYLKNTGTTLYHYIFNGNMFEVAPLANISCALLSLEGASHVVTNNVFYGDTFTVKAPVVAGPNSLVNSYVANNMFNLIVAIPSNTMIDFGAGTGNTDFMNKGQTYYTYIPVTSATYEANWQYGLGSLSGGILDYSGGATGEYVVFHITNSDIPTGVSIESIEIGYLLTGVNTDMTFQWAWNWAALNRGVFAAVSLAVDGVAGAGATTITLTNTQIVGTTITVDDDNISVVRVNAVANAGSKIIYGIKVRYIL